MFGLPYNTTVVLLGTALLGLTSGVIGTLTLLRRRALLGDALAHSTLPGICLAFLLVGRDFHWLLLGGFISGLLGVAVVGGLVRYTKTKPDAAIGIALSVFFGLGLLLMGVADRVTNDASQAGLKRFLLGQAASMNEEHVRLIAVVAIAVLILVALFYKELLLLSFDPHLAKVQGWPVVLLDLGMMVLLTATTVIGLPAVGAVLMVAMLILPGAAARQWFHRLTPVLILAAFLGVVAASLGTLVSDQSQLPTGPAIVLCGSAIFAASLLFAPSRGVLARSWRHRRLRRSRQERSLLRSLYDLCEEGAAADKTLAAPEPRAAVNRIIRKGWVTQSVTGIQLTAPGLKRAQRLVRARRLWAQYLIARADIDRDVVDPDEEWIDDVLPEAVVAELADELRASGTYPQLGDGGEE